jgi:ribosomal protein S18 acetylase RimI-like enzyme
MSFLETLKENGYKKIYLETERKNTNALGFYES